MLVMSIYFTTQYCSSLSACKVNSSTFFFTDLILQCMGTFAWFQFILFNLEIHQLNENIVTVGPGQS